MKKMLIASAGTALAVACMLLPLASAQAQYYNYSSSMNYGYTLPYSDSYYVPPMMSGYSNYNSYGSSGYSNYGYVMQPMVSYQAQYFYPCPRMMRMMTYYRY